MSAKFYDSIPLLGKSARFKQVNCYKGCNEVSLYISEYKKRELLNDTAGFHTEFLLGGGESWHVNAMIKHHCLLGGLGAAKLWDLSYQGPAGHVINHHSYHTYLYHG